MEASSSLRLDSLKLTNFRCFTECLVELHPKLTVLVADNAHGKTAVLNAISVALDAFVSAIGPRTHRRGFKREDIHRFRNDQGKMTLASHVQYDAKGWINGTLQTWSQVLSSHSRLARNSTRRLKSMQGAVPQLTPPPTTASHSPLITLPAVMFYGTGRLWHDHATQTVPTKAAHKPRRLWAYLDCLSPSSSYKMFSEWYGATADALRSSTSTAFGPDERPEKLLAAVRKAVKVVLQPTGWTEIDWDFPSVEFGEAVQGRGGLVVEHETRGRLPLSLLSDGVRNMVALVGDVAHRCARLNPHLGEDAASLTPGILLIDEVDMHLHPRWQQFVVSLLQEAFPAMQMVLTTHSPQVLSTVEKESIRAISISSGRGSLAKPPLQTRGMESADVLSTAMSVSPLPEVEEATWLNEYRSLIELGEHASSKGLALRMQLASHFGDRHPLILDCDRLIRFQAFKRRKSETGGN
jgi:predicted ATP-binding protein involved in virulence